MGNEIQMFEVFGQVCSQILQVSSYQEIRPATGFSRRFGSAFHVV